MPNSDESFRDRMRQVTLAHWGVMVIFGSMVAGIALPFLPAKNQAEQLGRGIGLMIGWGVGIVLVIVHFIRRRRGRKPDQR